MTNIVSQKDITISGPLHSRYHYIKTKEVELKHLLRPITVVT